MYIHKALSLSKLVLVLALGYVVVRTAMVPDHAPDGFGPATVAANDKRALIGAAGQQTLPEDYSAIIDRNIFGSAKPNENDSPSGGNTISSQEPADRKLGLALLGVVGGTSSVARAVIKDLETNISSVCRTGDAVASATVERIDQDRVIVLHEGQRKVLQLGAMPLEQNKAGNVPQDSSKRAPRADGANSALEPQPIFAAGLAYVDAILKEAVIEPHSIDGRVEGLRIAGLENIKGAGRFGLRNGDIIRAVNGHRLTDKQKAYQIFMKARSMPNMSLELLRGDEVKTLSFPLQ